MCCHVLLVKERHVFKKTVMNKMKGQIPVHCHHYLSVVPDNGRDSDCKPKGEVIDSHWQPSGKISQWWSHQR